MPWKLLLESPSISAHLCSPLEPLCGISSGHLELMLNCLPWAPLVGLFGWPLRFVTLACLTQFLNNSGSTAAGFLLLFFPLVEEKLVVKPWLSDLCQVAKDWEPGVSVLFCSCFSWRFYLENRYVCLEITRQWFNQALATLNYEVENSVMSYSIQLTYCIVWLLIGSFVFFVLCSVFSFASSISINLKSLAPPCKGRKYFLL